MADIIHNGQDVIVYKVYWTVWYSALKIIEVVECYSAYQAHWRREIIYQSIAVVAIAHTSYYTSGK